MTLSPARCVVPEDAQRLSGTRCLLFALAFLLTSGAHAQNVTVANARIAQPPPGVAVAAGYLDVTVEGASALRLVGVSSPRFSRVELHETQVTDGMATMHRLAGVMIGPGTTFSFTPGAAHLMLFDAAPPLNLDEQVPLVLHFSDDSTVEAVARVVPIAVAGAHHH
jgi:hypothetical protein